MGLVVLKPLSKAVLDGDQILGVIPGTATTQGGLSSRITVPSLLAQVSLYQKALNIARMASSQISYIEADGTETQSGDPREIASISKVFGESRKVIVFLSAPSKVILAIWKSQQVLLPTQSTDDDQKGHKTALGWS